MTITKPHPNERITAINVDGSASETALANDCLCSERYTQFETSLEIGLDLWSLHIASRGISNNLSNFLSLKLSVTFSLNRFGK